MPGWYLNDHVPVPGTTGGATSVMGEAGTGEDIGGGELRVVVQATEKTIPKNRRL
jgi:hypothetical protein